MTEKKKDEGVIRVRTTPKFKLKDKPGRQYVKLNFMNVFGFKPEMIIIEKIKGSNNTMIVRAVLTPEEIVLEDKQIKNLEAAKNK